MSCGADWTLTSGFGSGVGQISPTGWMGAQGPIANFMAGAMTPYSQFLYFTSWDLRSILASAGAIAGK